MDGGKWLPPHGIGLFRRDPLELLCDFIIAQLARFVKHFFAKSYIITEKILGENLGVFASWRFSFLLATIIPQASWFVKGFFQLFFRASSVGFEPLGSVASLQPRWDSPLDIISIPQTAHKVNG